MRRGAVAASLMLVLLAAAVVLTSVVTNRAPQDESSPVAPKSSPTVNGEPETPLADSDDARDGQKPDGAGGDSLGDTPPDDRPNILLITTDDMNVADLRWMPTTRRLLESRGVRVEGFLSNHPLCCPARAEILTGQYGHNSGVLDNERSRFGGYQAMRRKGQHVGAWLRADGYATAFVGKHLNGWEFVQRRQPGWTVFNPFLEGVYSPYDITMFRNGRPRQYSGIHTSDLVGGFTVRYIERFAADPRPFFIWASQLAPHGMFVDGEWTLPVPATRHTGSYPDSMPPSLSSPSFDEQDTTDKPPWVGQAPEVSVQDQVSWHRARIRSLLSVDEQVAAAVTALRATGQLDNTYIFFTSDNGYLMGEHGLTEKNVPYETALRVPLLVRGPGLPKGVTRDELYGLVDLAPTFLDIAGVSPPGVVDGRSMLETLRDGAPGYDRYLIQASGWKQEPGVRWWWRGVLTRRYVYARYGDGFEELYDLRNDPYQMSNVSEDPAYVRARDRLVSSLETLAGCKGEACRS